MHEQQIGENTDISDRATVGHAYSDEGQPAQIGADGTVRAGTIIYDDVVVGDGFNTGHHALMREFTTIGDEVLVGTNTVIDGRTDVGSAVSLQSNVYVPSHSTIGSNVFVGPCATLTNDPYPVRKDVSLAGPTLEDGCSIGANATILPDVTIGEDAFVAAGAVVTEDVPPETLAVGTPATHQSLPPELQGGNTLE